MKFIEKNISLKDVNKKEKYEQIYTVTKFSVVYID